MRFLAWLLRVEAVYQVAVSREANYGRELFLRNNADAGWMAP